MSIEIVTKEDLQIFRIQLLDDMKKLFATNLSSKERPEWIKSAEVRKILRVSPGTLQNLRISGKINPKKIEGTWYYSLAEINGLFEKKS